MSAGRHTTLTITAQLVHRLNRSVTAGLAAIRSFLLSQSGTCRSLTAGLRVDAARSLGNVTLDRASSVKGKLSSGITERARRRRGDEEERDEEG
ncbi:hypothetical protein [Actinacidiphila soli]|uniref:hypothetical protein n=1 Tax=Actinacidiphila soli TaxID=2487275 RepID=UPI000FCBB79A|nr:hypothetical protein [Actinacidiphila soli]